jgi:hypothetical protein
VPQGVFTIVPSAARTASGNSGALTMGYSPNISLQVTVSAVSGTTPSMTLSIQWSNDGVNFGNTDGTPDAFAPITAAATVNKQFTAKGLYMQITWTITGTTPSFTFFVIAG